jgi:Tol biopolymer transport system component
MKKIGLFYILIASFVFSSCTTMYQITSQGESFDALTKITDSKKICQQPSGGDENKNLVFCSREEDGYYNIYMKDNVLSSAFIQKTAGSNYNVCPDYCKANDKIVFQYWTKTNYDIYYINALKGKAITQVTNTDENEYNPKWSNNGKLIVFEKGASPLYIQTPMAAQGVVYKSGIKITENQIWIKNLETGELKMIGQGSFPRFSPDDEEIVFVKYDLNKKKTAETGTIWTMSADGESQKQLTNSELGYATCPCWSPDGKNIIFQLTKNDKVDADIYVIGSDGENLKQYTTNKSVDYAPYWSSDNYIYFTSDRGGKPGQYLIWRFKYNK